MDDRGIGARFSVWAMDLSVSSVKFRPAMRPTQRPIQWVPRTAFSELKRPGGGVDLSLPSNAEIVNEWAMPLGHFSFCLQYFPSLLAAMCDGARTVHFCENMSPVSLVSNIVNWNAKSITIASLTHQCSSFLFYFEEETCNDTSSCHLVVFKKEIECRIYFPDHIYYVLLIN
jgi:hypothetical protein